MSKLVFKSGFEITFPQNEWDNNIKKLKIGGVRLHMMGTFKDGLIAIPLTDSSIERLMRGPEERKVILERVLTPMPGDPGIEDSGERYIEKTDKQEQKESPDERNKRLLEIMIEKSSCKHEADKLILHQQDTKNGKRYFYVCSFCGHRNRYEKKADLLQAGFDLDTAIQWKEK